MNLPLFNFSEVIKNYNRLSNKQYTENENFGFGYLQEDMLKSINQLVQEINTSHSHFWFNQEDKPYLKKSQLVESLLYNKKNTLPHFVKSKFATYFWLIRKHATFKDNLFWQQLKKNNASLFNKTLDSLKENWDKGSSFTVHNNQWISTIAFDLLPALIKHHQRAHKQLKYYFFSIPKPIYQTYKKYIAHFLSTAQNMQQKIAENLYARLETFDQSYFTHSNVALHLTQQLNLCGALQSNPNLSYHDPLTSDQFLEYHHYIEAYGTSELKKKLHNLSWFCENTTTQVLNTQEGFLIAPRSLIKDIPNKIRWPSTIFKGSNFKLIFIKKYSLLFSHLTKITDLSIQASQNPGQLTSFIINCSIIEKMLKQAIDDIDAFGKKPNFFFRYQTMKFSKQCNQLLLDHYKKIITHKLIIATKMTTELLNKEKWGSKKNYPWQHNCYLKSFLQEIKPALSYLNDESISNQFDQISYSIINITELRKVYKYFKICNSGKCITSNELEYSLEIIKQIDIVDSNLKNIFISTIESYLNNILQHVKKQMNEFLLKTHEDAFKRSELSDSILCFTAIIQKLGNTNMLEKLDYYILKYFLSYLKCLLFKRNHTKKDFMEYILKIIGGKTTFGSHTIKEHIQKINCTPEHALELARQLNKYFLNKSFTKDISTFNNNIFCLLKNDDELNLKEDDLQELKNIQNLMIDKNTSNFSTIQDQLSQTQKFLTFPSNPKTEHIRDLLEISTKGYFSLRTINNFTITNAKMQEQLNLINTSINLRLFKNKKTSAFPDLFKNKSGKRELLSKEYIPLSLLD